MGEERRGSRMEMEHTGGGRTRMMLDEGCGKMKI
jgi:hypothetical protein